MTRDEAAALGSCTLKKKEGGLKAAVEMVIMIKMSIEKKHDQGDVVGALTYQIIVADAADAVSVNFSGRCKFFSDSTRKIGNLLCILP